MPGEDNKVVRIGIGGPVGSGKTALVAWLCRELKNRYSLAVVTNDIFTKEDAEFLLRANVLEPSRIKAVETGGCPHSAVREDASMNLHAMDLFFREFPDLELLILESGGDNLAATFSPEVVDIFIYVIDVSGGDKIPRKGGPAVCLSDLMLINKIDLADMVGASLEVMDRDARAQRGERPFLFTNLKSGEGLDRVIHWIDSAVAKVRSGARNAEGWDGDYKHVHTHSHSHDHGHSHSHSHSHGHSQSHSHDQQ